jgi:DNA polymerase-3 subunit gamma/tau
VLELDAASNNDAKSASQLIENIALSPLQGRYRVFILDECHCLTDKAFNILLKTLEEPPPKVIFVLCTTELHEVASTIVSRCQKLNFSALGTEVVTQHLQQIAAREEIDIEAEALTTIVRLCEGGMRDALQLLGQAALLDGKATKADILGLTGSVSVESLLAILQSIINSDLLQLLQTARQVIDEGRSPQSLISELARVYRDLLILKRAPDATLLLTSILSPKQLGKVSERLNLEVIYASVAQLQKAEYQLRQTTNAAVWAEVSLIGLLPSLQSPVEVPTLTIAPLVATADVPNGTSNGKHRNGNGKATATATLDLEQTWQQVVDAAKEQTQPLLMKARLSRLSNNTATLEVPQKLKNKFEANGDRIARMIAKATNEKITTIEIEVT